MFDQDVWWIDFAQKPHRIEEMSDSYVANLIGFLHAHRDYYYLCTLRRTLYQMLGDALLGRPNTDVLAADAGAPPLSELSPSTWLEGTPLTHPASPRCRCTPHRR